MNSIWYIMTITTLPVDFNIELMIILRKLFN